MPETKDGLEVVYGYIDQTTSQGKVYYNDLTGSAGTKCAGCGTAVNDGTSKVYWGSALVFASGQPRVVSAGTIAIGSIGSEFATYNIEAGSDGAVIKTTGGTAANVAGAIAARAGTKAGYVQLAYVTAGTSGSVLSGSIVDERTFVTDTAFSYTTGLKESNTNNPRHVYNGSSYAHSKQGRFEGKLSLSQLMVDETDPFPATGGDYMTCPRICVQADYKGVAGTTELVSLFANCVKEDRSVDTPEVGEAKIDYSIFYGTKLSW